MSCPDTNARHACRRYNRRSRPDAGPLSDCWAHRKAEAQRRARNARRTEPPMRYQAEKITVTVNGVDVSDVFRSVEMR